MLMFLLATVSQNTKQSLGFCASSLGNVKSIRSGELSPLPMIIKDSQTSRRCQVHGTGTWKPSLRGFDATQKQFQGTEKPYSENSQK